MLEILLASAVAAAALGTSARASTRHMFKTLEPRRQVLLQIVKSSQCPEAHRECRIHPYAGCDDCPLDYVAPPLDRVA